MFLGSKRDTVSPLAHFAGLSKGNFLRSCVLVMSEVAMVYELSWGPPAFWGKRPWGSSVDNIFFPGIPKVLISQPPQPRSALDCDPTACSRGLGALGGPGAVGSRKAGAPCGCRLVYDDFWMPVIVDIKGFCEHLALTHLGGLLHVTNVYQVLKSLSISPIESHVAGSRTFFGGHSLSFYVMIPAMSWIKQASC